MNIKSIEDILGVPQTATTDGLKVGNPEKKITGIAITCMATRRVVLETAQRGLNLLISHKPVFYHLEDDFKDSEADYAFVEKMQEVLKNSILLYRLYDLCFGHPDFCFTESLAACIGFGKPIRSKDGIASYAVVPDSLKSIAEIVKQRLEAPHVRILGKPDTEVGRIATTVVEPTVACLRQCLKFGAKCVIAAEADDLAIGYAADSNLALILCADVEITRPGLRTLTDYLKTKICDIPVEYIENSPLLTQL
ncbi:MAG: Nif3-like dinuclear metal center hexameric protein [Planctomycetota bacterium]|nr:Nif3-like dinuclear metal center hexameric protein [Planctomycetota bacterium]